MRFCKIKNRLIHEILQYLWRYNATSMAIFSPYIRVRVIMQIVLFSRLYGIWHKFFSHYKKQRCLHTSVRLYVDLYFGAVLLTSRLPVCKFKASNSSRCMIRTHIPLTTFCLSCGAYFIFIKSNTNSEWFSLCWNFKRKNYCINII